MLERGIAASWLEAVLEHPEVIEPDKADATLEHRLGRIPEFENRVLRVVAKMKSRPVVIVTIYFDRAMRGKL